MMTQWPLIDNSRLITPNGRPSIVGSPREEFLDVLIIRIPVNRTQTMAHNSHEIMKSHLLDEGNFFG